MICHLIVDSYIMILLLLRLRSWILQHYFFGSIYVQTSQSTGSGSREDTLDKQEKRILLDLSPPQGARAR
jgi:hypothetical protein